MEKTVEHKFIQRIKEWTGEQLIGDDCAVVPGYGLITADTLVEGTHFLLPGISYKDLGWKSVAVNLSDIAAMAGRPRYLISCLTLPKSMPERDFEMLFSAMVDCARTYRTHIVGGDLTRGKELVIGFTAIGDPHERGIMRRAGARPEDVVIATGDFGASAAGLWLMLNNMPDYQHCRSKHFRPMPRLCESWALVRTTCGEGALMDASDGLADAVLQIANASGVSISLDEQNLPVHEETRAVAKLAQQDYRDWALYGGEDYELVACVRPEHWQRLQSSPDNAFVRIGSVSAGEPSAVLVGSGGQKQPISMARTYQHW